ITDLPGSSCKQIFAPECPEFVKLPFRNDASLSTDLVSIPVAVAFLAGLLSFLSPCVLPLAPSYLAFVTGMSIDDLGRGDQVGVRRRAAVHAALFILGFSLVFLGLGATATLLGQQLRAALPAVQQVGGVLII